MGTTAGLDAVARKGFLPLQGIEPNYYTARDSPAAYIKGKVHPERGHEGPEGE